MKFIDTIYKLKEKVSKSNSFASVSGYKDLLEIVELSINAEESDNLAFVGPPASGKTLILDEILKIYGDKCMYCEGSATSAPGLKDDLNELWASGLKIECIIIDEADKMSQKDQKGLLGLFEDGKMLSQRVKKQYNFDIKRLKVYISCNDWNSLYPAFQSRFLDMHLPEYTFPQFQEVACKILPHLPKDLIAKLTYKVWYEMDLKDVRKVRQLGRKLRKEHSIQDIDRILNTITKYSKKK